MAKVGRKTKLTKKLFNIIIELKKDVANTNREICRTNDITEETFYKWIKENNEFSESIKEAEVEARKNLGAIAESSLKKRVAGYTYEEITTEQYKTKDKAGEEVTRTHIKKTTKQVPPSDTAVIFALTNTKSEDYKHKNETALIGDKDRPVVINIGYDDQ